MSANAVMANGRAISRLSNELPSVASSTTEAEYMEIATTCWQEI